MYRLFIAIIICFSIAGGFLVETSNAQRPSPLPVNCAKAAAATSIDNVTPVRQADGDFHFILDGWFPRVEECGFRSGAPGTATTAFAYAYRTNEYNDRFEFKLPLNGTVRKGTDYRTGYYDGYFLGGPTQIILGPNTENSKNYIKQPLRQYRIQLHYCVDVLYHYEYGECRNSPKQIKSGWVTVREPTSTPRLPTSTPPPKPNICEAYGEQQCGSTDPAFEYATRRSTGSSYSCYGGYTSCHCCPDLVCHYETNYSYSNPTTKYRGTGGCSSNGSGNCYAVTSGSSYYTGNQCKTATYYRNVNQCEFKSF